MGVEPKINYLVRGSDKVKGTFQGKSNTFNVLKRDGYGGIFAKHMGPKNENVPYKATIWMSKVLVTNIIGHKNIWIPKNQA